MEGFGSSSLATLPLGFNCGFISTSACGSSTGVCSRGCPGGLGFAPVRARYGGGAAVWVAGVLTAPDTQGSWWLGQQAICSRWVRYPVLAKSLQYSCQDTPIPLPDREAWQAIVYRVARPKRPCMHRCKTFFCLWQLCPGES